jgi:argininosuccinate lyase
MAADLIMWSTSEFGFVELADEYASSSSIMPQKKNPSTLELIRGKTGLVYGALMELLTMVKGVPSGYFQDLQGTKPPLWRSLDTVEMCLVVMTGVVSTLKVNEERMKEITKGSLTIAVDFAEGLVEEFGLPFREAYRLVANLIKVTLEKDMRLQDLTPEIVEETSTRILGKRIEVEQNFFKDINSESSVHRRKSQGSPNPRFVETLIRGQRVKLEEGKAILENRISALAAAKTLLRNTIKDYQSR